MSILAPSHTHKLSKTYIAPSTPEPAMIPTVEISPSLPVHRQKCKIQRNHETSCLYEESCFKFSHDRKCGVTLFGIQRWEMRLHGDWRLELGIRPGFTLAKAFRNVLEKFTESFPQKSKNSFTQFYSTGWLQFCHRVQKQMAHIGMEQPCVNKTALHNEMKIRRRP